MERNHEVQVEELRQLLQLRAIPLPSDKTSQEERKAKAAVDLEYFGKTYFPHYVSKPCSEFHRHICKKYSAAISKSRTRGIGSKIVVAAPAGGAKSTWSVLILILWVVAYQYRKFPFITSSALSQSEDHIGAIKTELLENEMLAQDFPEVCGEGPVWRSDTIVTRNGIKIRGVGSGQNFRGAKHGNVRPDLIVGDDIESDEGVESPEQRKKTDKWFFKKLLKRGQKNTVNILNGTILHYDSLLSNTLGKPGWDSSKFKSVIKYSQSNLWEEWERIYEDISIGKVQAEEKADEFFARHKDEMLRGTEVLWPEVEDYYYLMKIRASEGPAYFESEKQNEPINPEEQVFLEEWFVDWDDEDVDLSGCIHAGSCDPSLGKRNKRSDPSVIMAGRMKNGILYLDIADIEKRQPDKIMTDLLLHHEKDPFDKLRMETVQFQEFFSRQFEKLAHEKKMTINIDEYCPNTDKDLRIVRLQPWIKNGWIRFRKGMFELKRHLIYYRPKGKGGPDDGPDALEMLLDLCESGLVKAMSVADVPRETDYHADRFSKFERFGTRVPRRREEVRSCVR